MQLPCSRLDQTSVRLEHFASSVSRPMSASLETFPRHSRVQKAPTAGKRRDLNLEPRLVHLGQFVLLDHRGRHQRRKASSPSVLEWPRGSLAFQEHMLQTMPLFGAGTALPDFHARMMGQCFQLRALQAHTEKRRTESHVLCVQRERGPRHLGSAPATSANPVRQDWFAQSMECRASNSLPLVLKVYLPPCRSSGPIADPNINTNVTTNLHGLQVSCATLAPPREVNSRLFVLQVCSCPVQSNVSSHD